MTAPPHLHQPKKPEHLPQCSGKPHKKPTKNQGEQGHSTTMPCSLQERTQGKLKRNAEMVRMSKSLAQ